MKKILSILLLMVLLTTACSKSEDSSLNIDSSNSNSSTIDDSLSSVDNLSVALVEEISEYIDFKPSDFEDYEHYKSIAPSFLNNDQKILFADAALLEFMDSFGASGYLPVCYGKLNDLYYKTNYTYSSFKDSFLNTFECKYLVTKFNFLNRYTNFFDDKLYFLESFRGSELWFDHIEFELISQTDEKIEFKGIAYFDVPEEENQEDYTVEHNFEIINTSDGWRFDKFETWY